MKLVESVSQAVNNPPPCEYRVPSSINPVNRALVNSHFACASLLSSEPAARLLFIIL